MKKTFVIALLIVIAVGLVGCSCGDTGDNNGTNGSNGAVDYGEKNPLEGKVMTNDPGERTDVIKPEKEKELIGELKIAPHPIEVYTCYEAKGVDVIGQAFEGWTKLPKTKESWDAGIVHTFQYDKAPDVKWWIGHELVPGLTANQTEYFETDLAKHIGELEGLVVGESGQFKTTSANAVGVWVDYTFTNEGEDWKGRKLFYSLRGERISETEFGDGVAIICTAEGPAESYDDAWNNGYLEYFFSEVMVTQPIAQ